MHPNGEEEITGNDADLVVTDPLTVSVVLMK